MLAHAALGAGAGERVSTACLCIQAEAFDQLNGFDPSYWDHYFDIDLRLRLAERQRITVATPECTAILPRIVDADAPLLSNALRQQQVDQVACAAAMPICSGGATRSQAPICATHHPLHDRFDSRRARSSCRDALGVWRRRQPGRRPLLLMAQFDAGGECARI